MPYTAVSRAERDGLLTMTLTVDEQEETEEAALNFVMVGDRVQILAEAPEAAASNVAEEDEKEVALHEDQAGEEPPCR